MPSPSREAFLAIRRAQASAVRFAGLAKERLFGTPVSQPTIAVGITTYNRPEFFQKVAFAAVTHFSSTADLFVYNDGSEPNDAYERVFAALPKSVRVTNARENWGVAHAKNALLRAMRDYDYLFLLEDDIVPQSRDALTGYIDASRRSGIEHFNFAHHGPANASGPVDVSGWLEFYPNCIGAFSMYTRNAIEAVGYFDENFRNCWEHVEHTHRLAMQGFTSPFWKFADVRGSNRWLRELPQAIETSTIRAKSDWNQAMLDGLRYWAKKDAAHFPLQSMLRDFEAKAAAAVGSVSPRS